MMIQSLKSGLAQMWTNKSMLFIFYFANLLFGLVLMLPFRAAVTGFAGHSLMGTKLAGRLPMDFLFEFFKNNGNLGGIYASLFMVVPAIYWLVSLFLSGGAFSVFASSSGWSSSDFWGGGAKYFGRFFRLFLMSLPVFGVLFCLQFVETGVQRLFFGSDPYQNITYWGSWIRFGLRTISILMFALVFDYARIHAVVNNERKMRVSLWHGIKFAFGNLGAAFGLSFILFLAGALVLAVYNPIANTLSAPNAFVILTLFLLQQAYMFFRMMLRLALFSGQVDLFKNLSAAESAAPQPSSEHPGLQGLPA